MVYQIEVKVIRNNSSTAWKVSVFGTILVRIFPHSDLIWRDTSDLIRRDIPYSIRMRESTDQNNSEYGHFLRMNKYV